MGALCRGLPKYLFLPEDTCRGKQSQYRAWACWVRASPMVDRSDQTTFRASNFSLGAPSMDNREKPRLEIAERVRRLFLHGALELDGGRQTICSPDQAATL